MKTTQIRIPKAIFKGLFVSIGAFIVASLVLFVIVRYTPISPLAKILDFFALNHNSPVVYGTAYWRYLAPLAEYVDAFAATPLAMLIAGSVLGIFARRAGMEAKKAAVLGASMGVVVYIVVIAFTWLEIAILNSLENGRANGFTAFSISPGPLLLLACELALSGFAYGLGAWLVARRALTDKTRPGAQPSERTMPRVKSA